MRIRVLSYNIHKAIGVDGRFTPQRIVEILEHHNADIALLQEVDRGVPRTTWTWRRTSPSSCNTTSEPSG